MTHMLQAALWAGAWMLPAAIAAAQPPLDRTAHPYIRTAGDETESMLATLRH